MAIARPSNPLRRKKSGTRDASLTIIATEGEVTEKIYFSEFNTQKTVVEVLPAKNGRSSPKWIFESAKKLATNTQFGENDSFWIVIDRDQWEISELADVRRQCVQSRFNLLVSNPCFEIWLSFHCSNYPTSNSCKNDAVLALREDLGGYRGTKYDAKSLINKAALACDRAESLDDHQNEIFPQNPGSRVYQLVRHLLAN